MLDVAGNLFHFAPQKCVIAAISSSADRSILGWEDLRGAVEHQLGEVLGEDIHAVVIDELWVYISVSDAFAQALVSGSRQIHGLSWETAMASSETEGRDAEQS